MSWYEKTALVLTAIGALNWGLVAIKPSLDLVAMIGGGVTGVVARIIYALVGISGIYALIAAFKD
jgi:uncharacterized membrane protein YuzA (DUF378 family)